VGLVGSNQERSCTGTCRTLFAAYKPYWKNFSHHTGECWGTHQNHLGLVRTGRYSLEGATVRARSSGYVAAPPLNETDEETRLLRWLGATTLPYPETRPMRAHFDGMMASLSALMGTNRKLRAIVNFNDRNTVPQDRRVDASLDSRVMTTWVAGPRAVFWQRVLYPFVPRGEVDMLWLFAPDVAVHPSLNPFTELTQTLLSTTALAAGFAPPAGVGHAAPRKPYSSKCYASAAQSLDMGSSIVMKPEGFTVLHGTLQRLGRGALESAEGGLGELLCARLARNLASTSPTRIACVRLVNAQPISSELPRGRRDAVAAEKMRECAAACTETLRKRFPADFNATWHSEESNLCWAASVKGLRQIGSKEKLSPPPDPALWGSAPRAHKGQGARRAGRGGSV